MSKWIKWAAFSGYPEKWLPAAKEWDDGDNLNRVIRFFFFWIPLILTALTVGWVVRLLLMTGVLVEKRK